MLLKRLIVSIVLLLLAATVVPAEDEVVQEPVATEAPADETPAEEAPAAEPSAIEAASPETAGIPPTPTPAETVAPAALPAIAAEPTPPAAPAPAQETVRIYEVKKGDTLWGISRRFIDDPYYWPDLWANNPEIGNPHFIYPGQKLRIYAGPIMVVAAEPPPAPVTPPVATEPPPAVEPPPVPPAPPVEEPAVIVSVPLGTAYVSPDEINGFGEVYDFADDRLMATAGDRVFVRMKPEAPAAQVGDRYELYATAEELRHPLTRKIAGYKVRDLGSAEVTSLHDHVNTVLIRTNYREIERGAWLAPYRPVRQTIALKKARSDFQGYVIGADSARINQTRADMLFVDLGAATGIEVGNVLTITRPRKPSAAVKASQKTKDKVKLPDELVGYAVVVDVKKLAATAVILKSLGPVAVGDQVKTQIGN